MSSRQDSGSIPVGAVPPRIPEGVGWTGGCEPTLEMHLERARAVDAYTDLPDTPGLIFDDLPMTVAADVKSDPTRYCARVDGPAMRVSTSGSTGRPTVVYRSNAELTANARGIAGRWTPLLHAAPQRIASLLDHNRSAAGVLIEHVATELNATLARMLPYTPSGPNWPQFVEGMQEFGPTVIVGTPGVMLDIEHALRALGQFEAIRETTTTVLTLGATNTPAMRRRLSRSWQALVTDGSFGGTETGTIATGCRLGKVHSMVGRGVYEVLRDDGTAVPLEPGVTGEIIVTPTLFSGFVLIRYVTGDRVEATECPCGLDGVAFRVLGRNDDRVAVGGTWIGQAEIEHVVFDDSSVEDYQLVADLDDNLTRVEISLLPGCDTAATTVARSIEQRLGVDVVIIEAVSPLSRTAGVVKSWIRTRVRREVVR